MNKNFEFWKKLAYLLMAIGVVLGLIPGANLVAGAPFGLGIALCIHLLLALSRAEKLLDASRRELTVYHRRIVEDRPIVEKAVREELQLLWKGQHPLDLCLVETLPLPGIEYTSSTKHSTYLPVGKCVRLYNNLICHTAGRISLGQVRAVISEDWGLFELERALDASCLPVFYPPIYQTTRLSPQVALGMSTQLGIHRLSRAGDGSELHEIRDYHPGDSYRKMLWSATARTGKLIVRDFAAEVNIPVVFVLNTSWFLRFGSPRMMFDQLLETAMALARATYDAGDPFGYCLYGDKEIPTRFACQLPAHSRQRIDEMMKSILQLRVHSLPAVMLNIPELEKEVVKLINGRATSYKDYCNVASLGRRLQMEGLLRMDYNKMEYASHLADIADLTGLPTPVLHSHFKDNTAVEYQLENQEVQRLEKMLNRLIPMVKGKALFVVSIRPYEATEATERLFKVLSLIPRRSHRLLVLSPDYPSYTRNHAYIPRNSEQCLAALLSASGTPSPNVVTALDFYIKQERLRQKIVQLGGAFENIDTHKNILSIIDMINHHRYSQGGHGYGQYYGA